MQWLLIADLDGTLSLLWMIGSVAVGLGLVIFVHELGHFLAAKACGIKCEKFYIGFDIPIRLGPIKLPSALAKFRWGETEYGIGILPLGGYVKMLGQDDDPRQLAAENERIKVQKASENETQTSDDDAPLRQQAKDAATAGNGTDTSAQAGNDQEEYELDPRSLPAKPVWQRMIVFSAGVIMNLIFAVVFAAVAYRMGATYMPCVLGGTAPGDPAWIQGYEPGDKIIQIGRAGWFGSKRVPDEHLRFDKDLMINVTLNGANRDMDLLVRSSGQSQADWRSISPSDRLKDFERPATLGVRPSSTTKLSSRDPCDPDCKDEEGYSELRGGDEIIAVDAEELKEDGETGVIFEHQLEAILARKMAESVTLTVSRSSDAEDGDADASAGATEEVDVTLPPNTLRMVGIVMELGPIVGVRQGTPAEAAGFLDDDVLESFDGQPIGNPFTLTQRMLPSVGKEVEFTVRRQGVDEPVKLRATLVPPATYVDNFGPGSPVSLECLGVAFEVGNTVKEVEPGSPAEEQGIRAGDKMLKVQFLEDGEESGDPITLVQDGPDGEEVDLPNWAHVYTVFNMLETSTIQVTYRRGEQEATATLIPVASGEEDWYLRMVGLMMEVGPIVAVRRDSPAEEAQFQVGDVLQKINGEPVGNPFTLSQRLLQLVGEEVEFTVQRQEQPLRATLVPPDADADGFERGSRVSLECLGVELEVGNTVKEVRPGSPADDKKLQTGDKLVAVQFFEDGRKSGDPIKLVKEGPDGEEDDLSNWAEVFTQIKMLEKSAVHVTYRRGEQEKTALLTPVESQKWYYAYRRLNTTSWDRLRTSEAWLEAWALGYRETETSLKQVLVVLQRLFTGQISYKSMGGPIMIARAAGAEASHGVARLLLFLTFLSANLAVLNFLPIPALDGGHMVFLMAEAVRGKPVNERVQLVLTLIGVGCLLTLMVLVFALDIHRLPFFH